MTRIQLILKLLRTCHLNVPERRQLTPPAIHFTEILAVITDYLDRMNRFSSGSTALEKVDAGTYRLHYQRRDSQLGDLENDWFGPSIPATLDYASGESAVIAFMIDLCATRDLDGVEILGFPDRPSLTAEELN
jgi:hypothetical protein